jgi:hypothetical protein
METNIIWFKNDFVPLMKEGYALEYSFFENGDFGNLARAEFEGNGKGGNVDFWSSGWLNIHLVDYISGNELLNVLVEPQEEKERSEAFKKLQELL